MVKAMIKVGITPNTITITGFIVNVLVAILVIYSAIYQPNNLSLIGFAGAMVLFAGLFDMMDGRVARVGEMQSSFGALLDSTLDRYSELITLFSLQFYFILHGWIWNGIDYRLNYGELCKSTWRRIRYRCEGWFYAKTRTSGSICCRNDFVLGL